MGRKILECEKIEKSFFGAPALRRASFALEEGRVLGLVGENGAGKSTLMNILGGVIPFDAGRLLLFGEDYLPQSPLDAMRRGISFIHQELNLFANLSVAENLFISSFPKRRLAGIPFINRKEVRAKTRALLDSLELNVSPDAPVEELSPGERQLVEIARAFNVDARIIIFDEPTTSLTARETEKLFALIERLRARGVSMIYISHNLGDVLRLCDDILVLRDGEIVGSGLKEQFTEEMMISLMVGRTLDQLFPPRPITPGASKLLDVRSLSQPGVIEDISFALHSGEVLGIAGLMGAGRTELARILFGLASVERGEILIKDKPAPPTPRQRIRAGMAFLTEDRREEGLLMELSVAENIALVSLPSFSRKAFIEQSRLDEAVNGVAEAMWIKSAGIERQPVKNLSGGNQQKVVIARWLLEQPSIFILDEPTRGVDVGAKNEIYRIINGLAERGAGVLLISSEIEELIGMCDRILVMCAGEITASFDRNDFDREMILQSALGVRRPGLGAKDVA